jgi:hypothetical protein
VILFLLLLLNNTYTAVKTVELKVTGFAQKKSSSEEFELRQSQQAR